MTARDLPSDFTSPRVSPRSGFISRFWVVLGASVLIVGGLLVALMWRPERPVAGKTLIIHCAEGLREPVKAAGELFEKDFGVKIELRTGNTAMVEAAIRTAREGDLYIPGDDSFMTRAKADGFVAEVIPLAKLHLVLATPPGNPSKIAGLSDLTRVDGKIGVCVAGAAAGKAARDLLARAGVWTAIEPKVTALDTVTNMANAVKIGSVTAGFLWDATAAKFGLEVVKAPELKDASNGVAAGLLARTCKEPTLALRFARYLQAPEKGGRILRAGHFDAVEGDAWDWEPRFVVYAGGLNKPAIEKTLNAFEAREGVRLQRKFYGCGGLVSDMEVMAKDGGKPNVDVYMACDVSFLNEKRTHDWFGPPQDISRTRLVIITPLNGRFKVEKLEDLAQPGLRVRTGKPGVSTLGNLAEDLIKGKGLYDQIWTKDKMIADAATASEIIPGVVTGQMDSAIVYEANVLKIKDKLHIAYIDDPRATAIQPIAVGSGSRYKYLGQRLIEAIRSQESRRAFESLGFTWLVDTKETPAP